MKQAYEWTARAQRDRRTGRTSRHRAWKLRCLGAINRPATDWVCEWAQQTREPGDRPSAWAAGSYCDVTP